MVLIRKFILSVLLFFFAMVGSESWKISDVLVRGEKRILTGSDNEQASDRRQGDVQIIQQQESEVPFNRSSLWSLRHVDHKIQSDKLDIGHSGSPVMGADTASTVDEISDVLLHGEPTLACWAIASHDGHCVPSPTIGNERRSPTKRPCRDKNRYHEAKGGKRRQVTSTAKSTSSRIGRANGRGVIIL